MYNQKMMQILTLTLRFYVQILCNILFQKFDKIDRGQNVSKRSWTLVYKLKAKQKREKRAKRHLMACCCYFLPTAI